ncbi:MAG TPA: alpha/beta hydrolase fold domain-containing protein [Steroidobacteraceae bacterium]|nr:alpha/beta hydrolase fold domain-containing protein [Steroidobacteraceae bacterium]
MRASDALLERSGSRAAWALLLAGAAQAASLGAWGTESPAPRPQVDNEGAAHLPPVSIPASRFMSAAARAKLIALFAHPAPPPAKGPESPADIGAIRAEDERKNAPFVARAEALYPVSIEERLIAGVRTQVITPRAGVAPENRDRVLINLHGGGFVWGEGNGARAESIPIAGLGRITVITVAYRMAPEFKFPAASEDVAAVYRELLKNHRAGNIGIYGCSAGGILAGEAVAWFQKVGLPMPGAIGTFCGSLAALGGDSSHVAPLLVGEPPFPGADSGAMSGQPYFEGASPQDPLVLPISSREVLRAFPPTLLIAGSRDFMVSSLYASQAALAEAGVDAELHVWDGMWHAFFFDPDLPESQQVYRVVVSFFARHLGARRAAPASQSPARRRALSNTSTASGRSSQ